jgi:1-acyl-sn-glycerol-3-phosphate acyltransferase
VFVPGCGGVWKLKYIISLYVWTVAGLAMGIILVLAILFTFVLPPKIYDPWLKKMLRSIFKLIFAKVELEGAEKLDPNKTYLYMANHVSLFDAPLLAGFIPSYVRALEADRQREWPVYGWAVKRYGNIGIDRKSHFNSMRGMKKAAKNLQEGKSMVILPEGHRTITGELGPFKKLPFYLAQKGQVDIVPIGMSGLFTMKKKNTWHVRPTNIKVKFGEIIPADKVASMEIPELRDLAREEIASLIERP